MRTILPDASGAPLDLVQRAHADVFAHTAPRAGLMAAAVRGDATANHPSKKPTIPTTVLDSGSPEPAHHTTPTACDPLIDAPNPPINSAPSESRPAGHACATAGGSTRITKLATCSAIGLVLIFAGRSLLPWEELCRAGGWWRDALVATWRTPDPPLATSQPRMPKRPRESTTPKVDITTAPPALLPTLAKDARDIRDLPSARDTAPLLRATLRVSRPRPTQARTAAIAGDEAMTPRDPVEDLSNPVRPANAALSD
jgi:hypothetical protein